MMIKFLIQTINAGFRKENIDIRINEDGSKIEVSGKRAVQEMVLSGWIMRKKDVELKAFDKVFRIPDRIILDGIKAKFNDDESKLTIVMPKSEKGMRGMNIEEVKEEEFDGVIRNAAEEPPEVANRDSETEEIEPVVQEEIERRESETQQILAEVPNEEPKEEAQAFSERDNSGGMLQEKPEQPQIENKQVIERENFDEDKFRKKQDLVPETSVNMELQNKPRELEETPPPEKPKPPATPDNPETTTMESEEAEQEKQEPTADTFPDLKEQHNEQKIPEAAIAEEENVRGKESEELQEPEEKEPDINVQEPDKTEPPETMQLAKQPDGDHKQEDIPGIGTEIKEEASDQVQHPEAKQVEEKESSEVQKQKDLSDGASKAEKAVKRSKLCPPFVVAGSALLVTIIVFVINYIRSRRR